MTSDAPRSPADAALDVLVFAPLGLALDARELLPKLAERGRSQVTMARMVGQFAVQQGQVEAGKQIEKLQTQALTLLGELGLLGATAPDQPAGPEPVATVVAAEADAEPASAVRADERVDASTLAIPDYDSLAASQVIPRLEGLSSDELEAVRAYETAMRGRKTVLTKIAQLQG